MKKLASILGVLTLSVLMVQFAWAQNGVLLVDDDLSDWLGGTFPDVREKFTDALEAAGFTEVAVGDTAKIRGEYEVYNVITEDGPDSTKLKQYAAIIWFTGTTCGETGCYGDSCITGTDEKNLGAYLDGGGKLFLSAQDYTEPYGDGPVPSGTFAYEYLKVGSLTKDVWQDTNHTAQGTYGSVTEGFEFELEDPFHVPGPDLYIDKLERQSIPLKAHTYDEFYISDGAGSGYAAMSYSEGDQPGDYKTFFTSISFAALKDGANGTKAELMEKIMSWLLGDYGDYGDAPDPPYCSYFENNGAIHVNSFGLYEWLGENIDLEFNTWQVDNDLYDDGVVFNTPFVPGDSGSVDVTVTVYDWTDTDRYRATRPLWLHAWFDLNHDGDWEDTIATVPEFIIEGFAMYPHTWEKNDSTFNIKFPVPEGIQNEDLWMRFRLVYRYALEYDECCGYSSFGEVEDYVLEHPLSVGLSTFYASAGDGQATLYWTTESEVNNLGFYLMRSEGSGDYMRVNENLIPGHGTSETRHEYSYTDQGLVNGVTYSYKLVDVDLAGTRTSHGPITVTPLAAVQMPTEYALSQNYPNPFNAQTIITYAIPEDSEVSLKVFNVLGEEIRTLVDGHQKANTYQVTWDGKDADSRSVASGVYFCTLKAGEFSKTTKMVFLK